MSYKFLLSFTNVKRHAAFRLGLPPQDAGGHPVDEILHPLEGPRRAPRRRLGLLAGPQIGTPHLENQVDMAYFC